MFPQPNIRDDLGARVPLVAYDPRLHISPKSQISQRLRAASDIPRGNPTRGELIRGMLALVVGLPLTLIATLGPAYLAIKLGGSWWWLTLGFAGMIVAPAAITVFIVRRIASRRIAFICRRAGLCASCGYDLSATEPDRDGLRRCSECGASWNSPPPAPPTT